MFYINGSTWFRKPQLLVKGHLFSTWMQLSLKFHSYSIIDWQFNLRIFNRNSAFKMQISSLASLTTKCTDVNVHCALNFEWFKSFKERGKTAKDVQDDVHVKNGHKHLKKKWSFDLNSNQNHYIEVLTAIRQ